MRPCRSVTAAVSRCDPHRRIAPTQGKGRRGAFGQERLAGVECHVCDGGTARGSRRDQIKGFTDEDGRIFEGAGEHDQWWHPPPRIAGALRVSTERGPRRHGRRAVQMHRVERVVPTVQDRLIGGHQRRPVQTARGVDRPEPGSGRTQNTEHSIAGPEAHIAISRQCRRRGNVISSLEPPLLGPPGIQRVERSAQRAKIDSPARVDHRRGEQSATGEELPLWFAVRLDREQRLGAGGGGIDGPVAPDGELGDGTAQLDAPLLDACGGMGDHQAGIGPRNDPSIGADDRRATIGHTHWPGPLLRSRRFHGIERARFRHEIDRAVSGDAGRGRQGAVGQERPPCGAVGIHRMQPPIRRPHMNQSIRSNHRAALNLAPGRIGPPQVALRAQGIETAVIGSEVDRSVGTQGRCQSDAVARGELPAD